MTHALEQTAWYEEHREEVDKAMRKLWLLWFASFAVAIILGVMIYGFGDRFRDEMPAMPAEKYNVLLALFSALSVATLIAAGVLRWYFLRPACRRLDASVESAQARAREPRYATEYRLRIHFAMILPGAPSMFGFVLTSLGADPLLFIPFAVVSELGFLWQRPRRDELVTLARSLARSHAAPPNAPD